ncbi:RPE65-domain-containing protein [Setomelanomma holmii]|uniref:RPE65-domain-containing protein n=1 Tax=Setomelanomma holmii TaxID=210430 RepID=A0A9P4GVW7_9PLEO|nr:RPE65-domain-containing protein [Setomelanomma holmii]
MAPPKLIPFSIDTPPPIPLEQDDLNVSKLLKVMEHNLESVYNVPGYQHSHDELSHTELKVTGTLPTDLEGVYLRNGTNIQFTPNNLRLHAFSGAAEPPGKVKTWTVNVDSGKVVDEQILLNHHDERPSLNIEYVGCASRYCYHLDEECDGYMGKGVLKYDMLDKKEDAYFSYGEMYGGEALFDPRANARAENDGYLLDLLMDENTLDSIIIDAATRQEIARLHLSQRVPFGVHAAWLSSEEVASLAT